MVSSEERESVFSRRKRLHGFIKLGNMGPEVIEDLLPSGEALLYEKQLWDYKLELPTPPPKGSQSNSEKHEYQCKMMEIVKDAVSFYNSYGGYLLIGIRDCPREIVGFDKIFDVNDLNKRIAAATRHEVDCHFSLLSCQTDSGTTKVGLLFIPQRADTKDPAQFLRNAPANEAGKCAYKQFDIYFRAGDQCRPARSSDDYSFLCSQGRRQFAIVSDERTNPPLANNLRVRDPAFIRFIGREEYLQKLWRWLFDKYSPCKLLSGFGGVGKTTIAREFAENIVLDAPSGLEMVIWLSAKKQYYKAIMGKYQRITRADFTDTNSLLRALLLQLASTEEMINSEWTEEELKEQVIGALRVLPAFIVVDDLDSLEPEDQHAVFHTVLQVVGQTIGVAKTASRALMTARLTLGAAPSQLIPVTGLAFNEFHEFVEMTAKEVGVPWTYTGNSNIMKKFYHVSDGSPTFAASILRLMQTGEALESALKRWKGSQGEEVREFAFKRELDALTDSQIRTLYAACLLGETSLVELSQVTETSKTLLTDDLGELRKYHLLALGEDIPGAGPRLVVPSGIRLMGGLIKNYTRDPRKIEAACVKARKGLPGLGVEVGRIVHRVMALWKDDKGAEALEIAEGADKRYPDNADLKHLLGRCYLSLTPPIAGEADKSFRRAYELGCSRTELFTLWFDAKKLLEDWGGLIEISRLADRKNSNPDNIYVRVMALHRLGDHAVATGQLDVAARHFLSGAREIHDSFKAGHTRGRAAELADLRRILLESYINVIDRSAADADEHVQVFLAVMDASRLGLLDPLILELGLRRLGSWWVAVMNRKVFDGKAVNLMRPQLHRLELLLNTLRLQKSCDLQVVEGFQDTKAKLDDQLFAYEQQYSKLP